VTFRQNTDPKPPGGDVHVYCPESTRELCLAVLALSYISTARSAAINEYIHGPFDRTHCAVSSPDRLRYNSSTLLVLHYNFEGGIGSIRTDDETWHRLMKHIRHSASHILDIHLMISKRFWGLARWQDGAHKVLDQNSLCSGSNHRNFPNFLAKIAKIAAPASRWKNFSKEYGRGEKAYIPRRGPDYCSRGTTLRISIDGADSEERRRFVQELEEVIQEKREARPLFHWDGKVYTRTARERLVYSRRARNTLGCL
jgi:hypothetical protein